MAIIGALASGALGAARGQDTTKEIARNMALGAGTGALGGVAGGVITSYSIHYTKLYDVKMAASVTSGISCRWRLRKRAFLTAWRWTSKTVSD